MNTNVNANANELINKLNWEKVNGLIPAIIQDIDTSEVLMLGYMNKQALTQTISTNKITFYSRSKQALWVKGETSGNFLKLKDIMFDCDQDTLLALVKPEGPTCHLGTTSCFKVKRSPQKPLLMIENIIKQRQQEQSEDSYTVSLLSQGINRIAQKVGEEATETVVAALKESDANLCQEIADLFYHILVLLRYRELSISDVYDVLNGRLV